MTIIQSLQAKKTNLLNHPLLADLQSSHVTIQHLEQCLYLETGQGFYITLLRTPLKPLRNYVILVIA